MEPKITNRIMRWVVDDPQMILLFKNRYLNDDIWMYCITQEPSLFDKMKNPSSTFIEEVVKVNGHLLLVALKKWPKRVSKVAVYNAVKNAPDILNNLPPKLLDWEIREAAYDREPSLMQGEKQVRYGYAERRIREDPTVIQYFDATEDQICEAIRLSPAVCVYVKKFTPKIKALIKELYPESYPLLFPNESEFYEGSTQP